MRGPSFLGALMRPSRRFPQNKRRAASRFKRSVRRTKAPNVKGAVMRGGIRL